MRVTKLERWPDFVAYVVACRARECAGGYLESSSERAELIYPLEGGFILEIDGVEVTCSPARASVLPAGSRYRIRHLPRLPDVTLIVAWRDVEAGPAATAHSFLTPRDAATLQMLAADRRMDDQSRALLRRLAQNEPAAPPSARLEYTLERLLSNDATAADCARAACLSENRYRRAFRDAFGTTPHRVRRTLRLARALRMILAGDSATTAALACGFSHLSHLSNEFSALLGHSPRSMRAPS